MKKDSLSDLECFVETIKKLISIKEIVFKTDENPVKENKVID